SIKLYTDVWNTLQRGWLDNVVVRVQYQKNRSEAVDEHEFAPYLFEPAVLSHGVYVIGWSYTRDSLRTFKIDRILKASLTTERFEKSARVIPDEFLAHAWGVWYGDELKKVELLFAPSVARRVQETIWHPSQKTELMEDGSLLWWVEIAGLLELIPWIRGWGHEVEVLSPASLRREIAGSLRQAANIYD
ncbi:MAG: WYL domain-containing protein, partial [Anaerolineae bacterium]|nr:WYL domain-containing protein [Anaerolineae bacterium]